jgi:signal transduction histidine kinase/HPt (histidine-containing phosphotransfer) domain-containing protein
MTAQALEQVLLIEDNPGDVGLLRHMLCDQVQNNTALTHVDSMSAADGYLATRPTDIILLDLGLPDAQGLEAVRRARAAAPNVPLVVLTGMDDESLAVQALQEGAQDYLIKGEIDTRGLLRAMHYAAERLKAQQENIESRRVFEDLFDHSEAAIVDMDISDLFRRVQQLKRDGVRDLRAHIAQSGERLAELLRRVNINNANAAALRMHGVSSPQAIPQYATFVVNTAEAIFRGQTSMKRSETLTAAGATIPVVYSLRLPRTEEAARRVPIVIIDLSNVRLAEAARQATIAKSRFLSSMSHEIRTPLNGVVGNLELLALTALNNEQSELVDDADKAAKALLGLVGNILDFSKIEAGQLTTEIGDIDPAALVEEAVDVLQSRARQKEIFITATIGLDVPDLVRGDAMRFRQILLNLIGNAVKFTDQGGVEVTLSAREFTAAACVLRVEVHDSGRGFDPALSARLFEPFLQDGGHIDGQEGTGLGLSICKSLVEVFGGTIGCDATPGEGASFWFTMPATRVRDAASPAPADLAGLRVLFIDLGEPGANALKTYFMDRGATITSETRRAAPAIARETSADHRPAIDVAVIVPSSSEGDDSHAAWRLRGPRFVPLLYGAHGSTRATLRQGFATVIGPDTTFAHLDRNMRQLVGHVQARKGFAAKQAAVVSDFSPAIAGARVLVLEDRPINQTVIRKQLAAFGITCVLAPNGLKALEILAGQPFDLILCDCSMPEMNGYDFTRELRRRESAVCDSRHVPVVALTANAFREDVEKSVEVGMDDFVRKPLTMARLAAVLARWLTASDSPALGAETASVAPAISLGDLAEIIGSNEPKSLDPVLEEFMTVAGISLAEVAAAVADGDVVRITAAAHGARGEARCTAATRLADVYARLDTATKVGDQAATQALVACAAAEVRRVEDFIRDRLGDRPRLHKR